MLRRMTSGLLRPGAVARADHDGNSGAAEPQPQPEPERTCTSDDADRGGHRWRSVGVREQVVGSGVMSDSLEVGLEGAQEFKAEGPLLTDVGGSLPKAVLSTPGMIAMMENTATRLVAPALDDGAGTVGFEVCIKHVSAVL